MKGGDGIHAEHIHLSSQVNAVAARFLEVEIETGLLFCKMASERTDGDRRRGLLQTACAAHDVAQEWIWKLKMQAAQFDQLSAKLERLESALDRTA